MRIACPSCAAEYEVPASRLTPRKMVRCMRCGGEWLAVQELEADASAMPSPQHFETASAVEPPPAVAAPDFTAMAHLRATTPPPSSSRAGLAAAWVASLAVLAIALAAAVMWRQDVMRAWPPSSRLLGPIGQEVPAPGPIIGKKAQ